MTTDFGSEHAEQSAFIEWCNLQAQMGRPELAHMFAIPNGAKLPYSVNREGRRSSREAIRLIKEGLRPGVPDLFLPVPSGRYHGLFLETKYGKNKTTPVQTEWLGWLQDHGYAAIVCHGFDELVEVVEWYLAGGALRGGNERRAPAGRAGC